MDHIILDDVKLLTGARNYLPFFNLSLCLCWQPNSATTHFPPSTFRSPQSLTEECYIKHLFLCTEITKIGILQYLSLSTHACTQNCTCAHIHIYNWLIKRLSWLPYLSKNFGSTFFPRNVNVKVVVHKICIYNILSSNLTTELGTNDCTTIRNSSFQPFSTIYNHHLNTAELGSHFSTFHTPKITLHCCYHVSIRPYQPTDS